MPAIGIIHTVEPLKPSLPIDKVQNLARVWPKVADNNIDVVGSATNGTVQWLRPDLSIGGELKGGL